MGASQPLCIGHCELLAAGAGPNMNPESTSKFYAGDPPQDPFYPQQTPSGPSFLDTGACLCALQSSPDANGSATAWQCIGNQTLRVYETRTGKWFRSLHGGNDVDLPIDDESNGPATSTALMWNTTSEALVATDGDDLSPYDSACTGQNQTIFSTAFYRAVADVKANETAVDASPCYREGALPLQIQKLDEWQASGCMPGFLCANNTVNSLPQYCPPLLECQGLRLSGKVCTFENSNIGMGPFEPVLCQRGYYCPRGGKEKLRCPKGNYCQPGAPSPTPCSIGSICPEGAFRETFLIPLVIMLLVDSLLLGGFLWLRLRTRSRRGKANGTPSRFAFGAKRGRPKGGVGAVTATMTGYRALPDERDPPTGDHEMMAPVEMSAMYTPSGSQTGFQAALDIDGLQRKRGGLQRRDTSAAAPQLRAFIDSMSRATATEEFGLSFQYWGLSFQPRGSTRPVLQNINGSIEQGSLVAVMGGSGAGKSTFVNVLMGKTSNTGGSVTVNNQPGHLKRYKKLIGYVPQDDIVLPELTVYENIAHSARMRLPRNWTSDEIEAHVDCIIDCLELSHVRESLVGSVGKPVISGGQRKRVSIGMELATAPMAIFLDEPTSGLDATSASSIMRTLKALARIGISVIVIIHQPRMEIFNMLDSLILLANGRLIYEGPESEVQSFFESQGFRFPAHSNFGDVVTDIITGNGRRYKPVGEVSKDTLIAHWATMRPDDAGSNDDERSNPKRRSRYSLVPSVLSASNEMGDDARAAMHRVLKTRGAPRIRQAWLCLRRAMLQQYRSKSVLAFELALAFLAGFLIGLAQSAKKGVMFMGLYNEPYTVLSLAIDFISAPQFALLIAISIGLVAAAPGVKVFSEEMLVHRREAEAGHSRTAYFLAKVVSVLPRMLLGCLHFSTPLFLLATPVIPWGTAFVTNLLYFYAIYGLSGCISMVVRREDAPLFATMVTLIVGIMSGAAPSLQKVEGWHLGWLWRASPGVWLAELYFGQLVSPFSYLYQVDMAAKTSGFHLDWMGRNMAVLVAIGTIYRLIAFVGLLVGNRWRV